MLPFFCLELEGDEKTTFGGLWKHVSLCVCGLHISRDLSDKNRRLEGVKTNRECEMFLKILIKKKKGKAAAWPQHKGPCAPHPHTHTQTHTNWELSSAVTHGAGLQCSPECWSSAFELLFSLWIGFSYRTTVFNFSDRSFFIYCAGYLVSPFIWK